jgi:hypothetical protein
LWRAIVPTLFQNQRISKSAARHLPIPRHGIGYVVTGTDGVGGDPEAAVGEIRDARGTIRARLHYRAD